jgi:hypothetical protein
MSDRDGIQGETPDGAGWAEMRRLGLLAVLAALVLAGPLGTRFSSGGLPTLLRALSGAESSGAQTAEAGRSDPLLRPAARSAGKVWRGLNDGPDGDDGLPSVALAQANSRIFVLDGDARALVPRPAASRPYQARAPPGAA